MARTKSSQKITDEVILQLLRDELLIVDLQTSEVMFRNKIITPTLMGTVGVNGQRFRIEFRYDGGRRTISRNKLVYMAGSMKVIPDGFEVHHLDNDRFNDVWHNLVMLTMADHLKIHASSTDNQPEVPF